MGLLPRLRSLKERIDCEPGGHIDIDVGVVIQYVCVIPIDSARSGISLLFKLIYIDHLLEQLDSCALK